MYFKICPIVNQKLSQERLFPLQIQAQENRALRVKSPRAQPQPLRCPSCWEQCTFTPYLHDQSPTANPRNQRTHRDCHHRPDLPAPEECEETSK